MVTQFLTIEVDLQPSSTDLPQAIETALQRYGDPLRWAITEVNVITQTAIVEAIVTTKAES